MDKKTEELFNINQQIKKTRGKTIIQLDETGEIVERFPKHRVAILIGYIGKCYYGLQYDQNFPTIEKSIFSALVKSKLILPSNSDNPTRSGLNRAGRTDKGVSAIRNLISYYLKTLRIKIMLPPEKSISELIDLINSNLADDIKIWDIIPTTHKFDARVMCDSRKYEYLLPTSCLVTPSRETFYHYENNYFSEKYLNSNAVISENIGFFDTVETKILSKSESYRYRVDDFKLSLFNECIELYKGTRNFWNFTSGKEYAEKTCVRYIIESFVSKPFLIEGREFIRIGFHGQSFLLNQIRKMIGFAIVLTKVKADIKSIFPQAFNKVKLNIPKAPALGLWMEEAMFKKYNDEDELEDNIASEKLLSERQIRRQCENEFKKIKKFSKRVIANRDPINFEKAKEKILDFKNHLINEEIFLEDLKSNIFNKFNVLLDNNSFFFLNYLNFKGNSNAEGSSPSEKKVIYEFSILNLKGLKFKGCENDGFVDPRRTLF